MNTSDFIREFNEYYPYERYIMKTPIRVNYLFDDLVLTELFIPGTEIKAHTDEIGHVWFDEVDNDQVYGKFLVVKALTEIRLALSDFSESILAGLVNDVIGDFGDYLWEKLYAECENTEDLERGLQFQREAIMKKYGVCKIKEGFKITDTIEIIKRISNDEL